jgi:glycosyltransferase involved in cell wall biosynthesis
MYGADLILLQLVERLHRDQYIPMVALPTDIRYGESLTRALSQRNIAVVHLKTAILRRKYFTPWGLVRYIALLVGSTLMLVRLVRSESIDVVHSNTVAVIPGALAAWLTGRRHVWHVHEIITRPHLLWRFTSWLLPRLSDRVVAVSRSTLEHLCRADARNRTRGTVIYNGIDTTRFESIQGKGQLVRKEFGVEEDQVLVGMIGRVSHWKGQRYFVQVANQVLKTHPNARFALVGGVFPGQEYLVDELWHLIRELHLEPYVVVEGLRSDVPAVLDAFDVFVLPSTLPDPFPTVVLEAMAARRPVVANAHGGSTEMVAHGETGFLVDPHCPDEMAHAICRLIDSPDERNLMGQRGRERLLSCFSLDAFIVKWHTIYDALSTRSLERCAS